MNRLMLVVLACIPLACSGDATAPGAPGVNGQWIYRIEQLSDGGRVSCSMNIEDTLFLRRFGVAVQGSYSGGTISCSGADTESINLIAGVVVNGTVEPLLNGGQEVRFDFDGISWHQAGSLTGDRMSGTLSIDHVFAGKLGRLHLSGTWSAHRTSLLPPPPPPH